METVIDKTILDETALALENAKNIPEEDLPEVVAAHLKLFAELDKQIQETASACEEAKKASNGQVAASSFFLSSNKASIDSTQDAVRAVAEAQSKLIQAQQTLAENQRKMADCIKFLLMLGATSISNSARVISLLEEKLSHAAEDGLSDDGRRDLLEVIRNLRDQESVITKQDRMSSSIRENAEAIREIHARDDAQDARDDVQDERDAKHDANDQRHDRLLKWNFALSIFATALAIAAIIISIF